MEVRVRFAPSPTGQVHIGNIRTAIFNWLFARHAGGKFLLRIEDTDLERSTREAIDALLECMDWLKLDHDEDALFQSSRRAAHEAAAAALLEAGKAYRGQPGEDGAAPVIFRIPFDADDIPCVREAGDAELALHPAEPVKISSAGVSFATVSKKGKPAPTAACLAGFKNMRLLAADGGTLFELDSALDEALAGKDITVPECAKMIFSRREVFYHDIIKGELAKPLDGIKDLVIIRSNGSPVFHLANVCDDIEQGVTHIVRGDDHVENTYRHLLLYNALGAKLPHYAHMPMIVNHSGKPYSKRDGDAYVGDFRKKGFLPEALFNYLTLLGWSPGDDREKMTRREMIEAFTLDRVKSSPAQFDANKLLNLNGQYVAEMELDDFMREVRPFFAAFDWSSGVPEEKYRAVAELMQTRTRDFTQVASWEYFFSADFEYGGKQFRKQFKSDENRQALSILADILDDMSGELDPAGALDAVARAEKQVGLEPGGLYPATRLAVSGVAGGAELDRTMALIGAQQCAVRIRQALQSFQEQQTTE